jgi:hypothetical protein
MPWFCPKPNIIQLVTVLVIPALNQVAWCWRMSSIETAETKVGTTEALDTI